jgi:hypothetical protein
LNDISDEADPFWLPLGAPATNTMMKNFPAYPSGHATFAAAAFHVARLFYGAPSGKPNWKKQSTDDLFKELGFVSEELNGENRDNQGTVRPRHVRAFPKGL